MSLPQGLLHKAGRGSGEGDCPVDGLVGGAGEIAGDFEGLFGQEGGEVVDDMGGVKPYLVRVHS